jgi:hypothetical protein
MAGLREYAEWIIDNPDKKGTEDYETIAAAFNKLNAERKEALQEDTTALGRGLSRGVDVAGRGFGSALEGLGSVTDIEALEKFGAEMVAENEAQLAEQEAVATRLGDVEGVGTGLDYFLETLGETAPQTGLSLGAGAAAGAAAGSFVPGIGTIVGGLAGAALSQIPFFYGNNREAQKEAIQQGLRVEMSESAAFLNSLPQAALDAFAERLMVGRLLPTQKAIRAGGLFTRVTKGAGTGAAVEVPTELGQTLIERAQAGLELDSEEAVDGYIETAVAAGLIGGTLGGGAAGISRDSRAVEAEQRAIVEQEEQEAADAAETAEIEALLAEDAAADDAETAEIEALLAEDADAAETAAIEALLAEDAAADEAAAAEADETVGRSPVAATIEEEKEDSEALTVPPVTLEQDPAKQRYSILQQVIEDTPTNNYTTLQRAFARRLAEMGVADTAITEAERNTIVSAVNVQRAPEEVESRGPMTVRTIEDTSVGTAEIEERIPERAPTTPTDTAGSEVAVEPEGAVEPEVAVDEVAVDEVAVDEVAVDEVAVDEVAVDNVAVDDVAVDDVAVDDVAVDDVAVDEPDVTPPAAPTFEVDTAASKKSANYPLNPKFEFKPYTVLIPGKPTRFYTRKSTAERIAGKEGGTLVATAELNEEQTDTLKNIQNIEQLFASVETQRKAAGEKPETLEFDPKDVSWTRLAGFDPIWGNKDIALRVEYVGEAKTKLFIPMKQRDGKVERYNVRRVYDVSNPTTWSKVFSATELAELREAKRKAIAIDEAEHRRNPDGPFQQGATTSFSTNFPKELANTAQQFISLLGLKDRVYITTFEDASNPEEVKLKNLYGPFDRIAGAASDPESVQGYTQQLENGDHVLVMRPQVRVSKSLEVLAHELGHIFEKTEYQNATKQEKEAIQAEYQKWRAKAEAGTFRELINSLRARTSAKKYLSIQEPEVLDLPISKLDARTRNYFLNPRPGADIGSEWFADQVSRWAVTSEKPLTVVDKFFARVAAGMRRLYQSLAGKVGLPSTAFKDFLDSRAATVDFSTIPFPEAVSKSRPRPEPKAKVKARTKKTTVAGGTGVRGNLAVKPEKEAKPKKGLAKRAKAAAAKERAAVKGKEDPTLAEAELEAKRKAKEAELQEIEAELIASGQYVVETDKDRAGIRQVAIRKQRERRFDRGVYNVQAQFDPDLDAKLDSNTIKNIKEGNLKGALTALAYATDNPRVAKIASKLVNFVGDTRVVIVPAKPTDELGKRYRAALDEEANTKGAFIYSDKDAGIDNVILLDDTAGVTAHNLLHEMAHAATIQELQKPSSPVTKQLTNLYNYAKPYMDGYYGSESVEEFVAEVFGNYKFRQHLATIPVDGDKTTVFQRVLDTIKQFIRRITGTPSDVAGTADRLIEDILAPYEGVRGSGILYNSSVIGKAKDAFENMYESVPTFKEVGERGIVKSLLAPVPESAKKFSLGLLDLNAITKIAEGKLNNVKELLRVVREQSGAINKFNTGVEALTKRTAEWAGKNVEKMQELSRILTRSTYLQLDPTLTLQEAQKKYGKTINKVWVPDPEQIAAWKDLRDRYNKLGVMGQNFYKAWRNQYKAMYDQVRELIDNRLSADVKNPADRKVLVNKLYEKLTSNGVIDPYFPLMRIGKFWLEYNAVDPDTGNIEYYIEAFANARERKEAIKQIEKHWSNPDAKNKATVEKLLADTGKTKAEAIKSISGVNAFASLEQANFRKNAPPTSFVNSVLDILEAGGIKSDNVIQEQIMRLFLDTLPERSFANSFRHRKNRRGAMGDVTPTERQIPNHDIIFGLRNRALNLGQQLSRIKYGAQMRALQDDFNKQAADINNRKDIPQEDKDIAILLANELSDRAAWAASPMVQPWARLATSFGFNMTLGLNISSALVNLSQIPMVVVPYLGAQYGYGNTAKALQEATKIFMGSGNKRKVEVMGPDGKTKEEITAAQSLDNYDFDGMDKNNPLRRFATLSKLADDLGQLNRSIAYDIGDVEAIDNPMAKVNSITGFIFHHGERANRQVAMIMAYDLALQKKLKDKGLKPNQWEQLGETELNDIALDALNVTEMTNGGIAAAAAPRIARDGIGKVAFLFKRYGSAMYFMLYDLIDTSFTGNEKDRKIARAQLRGVFGGAALVAGVQGLPFFGVVAMISNMFKEDDEEDFETSVRKYIGEGPYGGVVNYLFGVDVASRMGLSNLIFRDRMIEKDQSVFFTAAEQLGGPVLGSLMQIERGAELWGEGQMLRGIEAAMPAAIRNGFKSVRFANEGARTLRGDPIVEDFHAGHIAAQFMGFAPAEYTLKLQKNAVKKKIERAVLEERSKLLSKYYTGMRNNNVSAVQRIMEDMADFNSRHSYFPITPDTIKRSMMQHMRSTAEKHYGITINPKLRNKLLSMSEDWDDSPTFASDFGL